MPRLRSEIANVKKLCNRKPDKSARPVGAVIARDKLLFSAQMWQGSCQAGTHPRKWHSSGERCSTMSITHKYVQTNGIRMHVTEAGSGFPVLLCHGFPELWYSWRHQITALADAGFRVIAPDQRGYGETDAPTTIDTYSIHHLVGDLTGLLDALEIDKAVIVGHDWGGLVVWQMALLAPQRVAANCPSLSGPIVSPP